MIVHALRGWNRLLFKLFVIFDKFFVRPTETRVRNHHMRPGTASATLAALSHDAAAPRARVMYFGCLARFSILSCTLLYSLYTTRTHHVRLRHHKRIEVPRYLGPAPWPRHRGVVPPCKPPRGPHTRYTSTLTPSHRTLCRTPLWSTPRKTVPQLRPPQPCSRASSARSR